MGEEKKIIEIDINYDHSEIINSIIKDSQNLTAIIFDIHRHYVPKIQYQELNGILVPVMYSLGSNDNLIIYTESIHYRVNSFIVQIEIIEETLKGLLVEANKDKYEKLKSKKFNDRNSLTRLNVLLDNLIIYSLTLIEYTLTYISHICSEKIINNWKQFFNEVRKESKYDFLQPKVQFYNRTITKLQEYRNSLIHKQINSKYTKVSFEFNKGRISYEFHYSDVLLSTTKKFAFKDNLDFSNNIILHYSIVKEFIKVSSDIALTLRDNMFDENGKAKFY